MKLSDEINYQLNGVGTVFHGDYILGILLEQLPEGSECYVIKTLEILLGEFDKKDWEELERHGYDPDRMTLKPVVNGTHEPAPEVIE